MNQAPDTAPINSKLGEHIGGSRADRALLQENISDKRWMRSWKIVPRRGVGGTYYSIESRKLFFRAQYPSYERAEEALATELAFRILEPFRDDEGDRLWRIRQRRDPGLVVSQETWSSFNAVCECLRDANQCKVLLLRELMLSDESRQEAARARAARQAEGGRALFPAGWEAREEEGGWRIYKRGVQTGMPCCLSLAEALAKAREGFVRERFRIVSMGMHKNAIARSETGRAASLVVKEGFASAMEADAYLKDHVQDFLDMILRKPRPVSDVERIPLKEAKREGPTRREGPAEPAAFLTAFGFHGVEFGLWNSQSERQRLLDMAWDGLMDLADVLGLPPKALSLDGQLSLAFGARGNGGSAAAHYEYSHAVINLTKRGGAGCLAHEWFHALDHYLGRRAGYASDIRTALADGGTGYVVPSPGKATLSGLWSNYGSFARLGDPFADVWKRLCRAIYGKLLSSDYYKHAAELDKGRGKSYWTKSQEMLARAFEAYVEDCIEKQGRRSEFLVNGTRKAVGGISPYPEGLERSELANVFREFAGCTASMLKEGAEPAKATAPHADQPAAQASGMTQSQHSGAGQEAGQTGGA